MQRNGWAPLTFLVQPPKLRQGIAVVNGAWFEETAIRNPPGYAAPFYVTPSPFSTASTLIFCVSGRFACRLNATLSFHDTPLRRSRRPGRISTTPVMNSAVALPHRQASPH